MMERRSLFHSMFIILWLCQNSEGHSEAAGGPRTLYLSLPGTQKTCLSFLGEGGACFRFVLPTSR